MIADAEKLGLYVDAVPGAMQEELIRTTMDALRSSPQKMKLLKMLLD
jgi:hypothetical protein